jgi:hypothetical protein
VYIEAEENEHGEHVHRVWLRVGVQLFALDYLAEKEFAEWYSGQLRAALRKAGATCTE